MATLIKKLLNPNPESLDYASSFSRSVSSGIDMLIVLILRITTVQICANLWYNKQLLKLATDFEEQFGTTTPKSTTSHVNYLLNHPFITHTIILVAIIIFVGVIYYTYFNSSKWQTTPGKRLFKIQMVKKDDEKIDFITAFIHYILSITPYAYFLYIAFYKIHNEITFFEALTSSRLNLMLGIFFVLWIQIHIFTKKRVTLYDMICKISFKKGRTNSKYPWQNILGN